MGWLGVVVGSVCPARADVAGDEDSIAAFFLTNPDEQTHLNSANLTQQHRLLHAISALLSGTHTRSPMLDRHLVILAIHGSRRPADGLEKRLRCVTRPPALQPRAAPHAEPVVSDDEANAVRLSAGGAEGNPEYREEPSPQWRPLRG